MQASTFAPSPLTARASAVRSRTCGRQRLAFLAASATGGARKPNPSEGAEAAAAAKSQICHCSAQGSRDSRSVHSGVFNSALVLFTYLLYNNILARRGEAKKNPHRAENPLRAAPLRAVHYVFGSKK